MELNFQEIRQQHGWSIEFVAQFLDVSEELCEALEETFDKFYFEKYLLLCDLYQVDIRLLFQYLFLNSDNVKLVFDLIDFYESKLFSQHYIPKFAEN